MDVYGRAFLDSFIENWPCDLVLYEEEPMGIDHPRIEVRNLFDVVLPGNILVKDYLEKTSNGRETGHYNYNYDVNKFCRKVFAQYDAVQSSEEPIFWLDADIYTFAKIPAEFLERIFEGHPLVFLGREYFYTETGFVGFDPRHPKLAEFMDRYIRCYTDGTIYDLRWWHDCGAFDYARERTGIDEHNLSKFYRHGDSLHVFLYSPLGFYMDHKKGNRKHVGFSKEHPIKYWKEK